MNVIIIIKKGPRIGPGCFAAKIQLFHFQKDASFLSLSEYVLPRPRLDSNSLPEKKLLR